MRNTTFIHTSAFSWGLDFPGWTTLLRILLDVAEIKFHFHGWRL